MSRHDWARLARRVEVPVSPNRTDIATAVLRRLDRLDELERNHQRREPVRTIAAWADEHPAAMFLLCAFVMIVGTIALIMFTGGPAVWDGCHAA